VFVTGREAILAGFRARPPRTTRHVVANIRVTVAGATATATSQVLLFTGPAAPPVVGSNRDRLILTEIGWKFAERIGSLDFSPA